MTQRPKHARTEAACPGAAGAPGAAVQSAVEWVGQRGGGSVEHPSDI